MRIRTCLLAIALALCASAAPAQSGPGENLAQPPLCDPALIDGTYTFASLPAGSQTVSLHFRNASAASCRLQDRVASSFAVDGHSMRPKIGICWLCDQDNQPSPAPQRESANQILLAPGALATVDLYWSSTGLSCQYADWVGFNVQWARSTGYLFTPSEWPLHVCSDVRSSGYRAGPGSLATGTPHAGALRVSIPPNPVYSDERVRLHVELASPPRAGLQPVGCAALYTVRDAAGTRLDPLPVLGARRIKSYTGEQTEEDEQRAWPSWRRDHLRTCPIPAGTTAIDADIEASDLATVTHIEWRPWHSIGAPAGEPAFEIADTHFTVLDPDTLAPNWGDTVHGIHAGLSIDRATFTAGEQIPLHMRWENVSASGLGQSECAEQPSLELQNAQHAVLETIPLYIGCFGHGWGPFAIPTGKPQRSFRELTTASPPTPPRITPIPPDVPGPGVYYLVSVWTPLTLDPPPSESSPGVVAINPRARLAGPYATARSQPVRIEVIASTNSDPSTIIR